MALRRRKPQPIRRITEAAHKINRLITAPELRVVGDNVEVGVYPTREALRMAEEQELDLVEISPKAVPPVAKIIDYKKFLYDQKKKKKELAQNTQKVVVKEIRFGPNTSDHDYEFKMKHAQKFLEEGAKLKAFVFFRGRSIMYMDRGRELIMNFANGLIEEGIAKLDQPPKREGKKLVIILSPKK